MAEKTRLTILHYGGQEYELTPDAVEKLRSQSVGTTRVVVLDLDDDRSLTLVVGPNIPLAIKDEPFTKPVFRSL
jgi:hypothetical protein